VPPGLVQALARTGRALEALELFEALLDHASPLGLFAEELDPPSGAHLGNFPQTLTHAALVQAALALRESPMPLGPPTRERGQAVEYPRL
jgi:GH15 family glucan-1,4-alpha-glucosidase